MHALTFLSYHLIWQPIPKKIFFYPLTQIKFIDTTFIFSGLL